MKNIMVHIKPVFMSTGITILPNIIFSQHANNVSNGA